MDEFLAAFLDQKAIKAKAQRCGIGNCSKVFRRARRASRAVSDPRLLETSSTRCDSIF